MIKCTVQTKFSRNNAVYIVFSFSLGGSSMLPYFYL